MPDAFRQDAAARRAEIAALVHYFPGVQVWFGVYTRHWWALHNGRLYMGRTPAHIGEQIAGVRGQPWPSPNVHSTDPRPSGGPAGGGGAWR